MIATATFPRATPATASAPNAIAAKPYSSRDRWPARQLDVTRWMRNSMRYDFGASAASSGISPRPVVRWISRVTCIEQNFGPHIEQNSAVLK